MNTVYTIFTEVTGQKVALPFRGLYLWRLWCGFGPGWLCLCPIHGVTCEDGGVVVHMNRCEGFAGQVRDLITELVVTRRDKASPLVVKGMEYGEIGVADVSVFGEVWGL